MRERQAVGIYNTPCIVSAASSTGTAVIPTCVQRAVRLAYLLPLLLSSWFVLRRY